MHIPPRFLSPIILFLALLASGESRRSGYRLPQIQGRSASGSPSSQDVGSGRDLMKKFMMMRGLFQQPPSDNVIIISDPTSTTTTTTTGTPTTTTTTTTTNSTGRAFDGKAAIPAVQDTIPIPIATMTALAGLEDRLDLPEEEPLVLQEVPKYQKKRFRVKNRQLGAKRSHAKKKTPRRRVHRHHKKQRSQKKSQAAAAAAAVNQQRNSESPASSSAVNFIEPYHNDRPQRQASQSGTDSRLQRIWRRFQIAH